jgi:hypothetical protein
VLDGPGTETPEWPAFQAGTHLSHELVSHIEPARTHRGHFNLMTATRVNASIASATLSGFPV